LKRRQQALPSSLALHGVKFVGQGMGAKVHVNVEGDEEKREPEVDYCEQCMEDGKMRDCCQHVFCKHCYESTGCCPHCERLTTGENKGKFWSDLNKLPGPNVGEVRDGEECRMCMRQGFRRTCCGEFYCGECYFKSGHCPSCNKEAKRRIKYQRIPRDPGFKPVLLGYFMSLLVCMAALAVISVTIANNASLPETIFGYRCFGFFPECSADDRCVEFSGDIGDGIPDPITSWVGCDLNSERKMYGSYCVHDEQVFVYSAGRWGFDFCEESFDGAVVMFQDTFDHWEGDDPASNLMVSATWAEIVNGKPGIQCGVSSSTAALYFSGPNVREAETLDVAMPYGGYLHFWVKMGPNVADQDAAICKPAYGGNVLTLYSTDEGVTWHDLELLNTWQYRFEHFTEVKIEVPVSGPTTKVRFRWQQENFQNALEHWALDDVRIVSHLKSSWSTSEEFAANADASLSIMQQIKCCLNSSQCDASKRKQEGFDCSLFADDTTNQRALAGAELFVVLAGALTLIRWLYASAQAATLRGWQSVLPPFLQKKHVKLFNADDPAPGAMDGQFSLSISLRWRLQFMGFTLVPLGLGWLWCAILLRNFFLVESLELGAVTGNPWVLNIRVHISGIFLLATYIDASNIFIVARDVICILPGWLPILDIDLRPSAGWLRLGQRTYKLGQIKETEMFSESFCRLIAGAYIVGLFPWCLIALIVKYNYLPYSVSRYTTLVLGGLVVLRAWLGPDWVIKLGYSIKWLVTCDLYNRDEIGTAFTAVKARWLMGYSALCGTLLAAGVTALLDIDLVWIFTAVGLGTSAFYGAMLAVVQGLPITPLFKITTLSRGMYMRVHTEVLCPCERNCSKCGEMHSRDEILIVFVRDALSFAEMLSGDDTVEMSGPK
ncbi:unnamed protein product, partial [Chrysoparadoxa australica]